MNLSPYARPTESLSQTKDAQRHRRRRAKRLAEGRNPHGRVEDCFSPDVIKRENFYRTGEVRFLT